MTAHRAGSSSAPGSDLPSEAPEVLFFTIGTFSHINASVRERLAAEFPEYRIRPVDIIESLLKPSRRLETWANIPHVLAHHGLRILRKRARFWSCFYQTPHMFRRIKAFAGREAVRSRRPVFTFQMQSLCDASVPGIPHFVYTDHTHLANRLYPDFPHEEEFPPRWVRLEGEIYRNARTVFTMSSHVSRSLEEYYGCDSGTIDCVYAGCNAPVQQEDTDPYRARGLHPDILFVGVEWERKGGPELLAAFDRLRAVFPGVTLTIVGCSPNAEHIPNVRVVGPVPLDEVPSYYRRADIFCMPTRREPFGIVFAEACHYGLPIVATNIGALPDIVRTGETGILVQPGSTGALTDALAELVRDRERAKLFGSRARDFARNRYTWEAVGQRLANRIRSELGANA